MTKIVVIRGTWEGRGFSPAVSESAMSWALGPEATLPQGLTSLGPFCLYLIPPGALRQVRHLFF